MGGAGVWGGATSLGQVTVHSVRSLGAVACNLQDPHETERLVDCIHTIQLVDLTFKTTEASACEITM